MNGVIAQIEALGDAAIAEAAGDEPDDFDFAP
jgi:hypothetical protein